MTPPDDIHPPGHFSAPSPEELGALIPDYKVGELIAQGGMGAVYRGVQTKLDRTVAIKVLPKDHGADHDYAARFQKEAKSMARLTHSNIVGVYDYGETSDGEFLYFIMEFIEGSDLQRLLHEGPIPYDRALSILMQTCDALDYAHGNRIIHLDIKPANILLDSAGNVKIADFGLAKHRGAEDEEEDGPAFGTPDYVAPETLVQGVEVNRRADIYSLGVVMYEVFTGQVPQDTCELPSTLNPAIDRRLDDIIFKALAHDRDERHADAREIYTALQEIAKTPRLMAAGGGVGGGAAVRKKVQPLPQKKSNAGMLFGAIAAALLLVSGALYWIVSHEDPPPPNTDVASVSDGPDEPADASGEEAGSPTPEPGEASPELASKESQPPDAPGADESEGASTSEMAAAAPPDGAGLTALSLPPELRGRAGRLRIEGTNNRQEPLNNDGAEGFDDIIAVRARAAIWHALRAGGETLSNGRNDSGIKDVKSLEARRYYLAIVREDGTVWKNKEIQLLPGELTTAVQSVGGNQHDAARLEDGTVKIWGPGYGSPEALLDFPEPVQDAVDISASQEFLAVVDADGRVICINKGLSVEIREPENEGDQVVDVEAGNFSFVALTKSGRVFTWGGMGVDDTEPAPEELGPAVAVRAGSFTSAAQRSDGTWFAWGKNPNGIVDKINRLPPTPDIAFTGMDGESEFGYVMWIEPNEPSVTAAPAAAPSPPPAPEILGRVGRIRIEGTNNKQDSMATVAGEDLDDFIRVRAETAGWMALRANGDVVSVQPQQHGATDVMWLGGRNKYGKMVRKDGTVWDDKDRQLLPEDITTAVQAVGGHQFHAVRLGDGTVKMAGAAFGSPNALRDFPVPISNAVDISSSQGVLSVVDADGRLICLDSQEATGIREPEDEGDRVIDVEGGVFHTVALTKSGRVFTWSGVNVNKPKPAPEGLGPSAVAVRAGPFTSAAQRPDGTWFAWGVNANGIVDKINSLPPTPDIAFAGSRDVDNAFGYVIWIEPREPREPVVATAPADAPIATGPGDARIADLLANLRRRHEEVAQQPFEDGLAKLNEFYLGALDREDDTTGATPVRNEITRVGQLIDAAGDGAPPLFFEEGAVGVSNSPKLAAMRARYLQTVEKLKNEKAAAVRRVRNEFATDLAKLNAELEREFGSAEASKAERLRDTLIDGGVEALLEP